MIRRASVIASVVISFGTPLVGHAQTATYHLHNELSNNIFSHRQMRTDGPAPTTVVIQSADLKNATGTASVDLFDTLSNVPNVSGTIPAFTTVSATFWMKKTANWGVFKPSFALYLNSTFPQYGTFIASCVGSDAISQTLGSFLVSCQTQNAVTVNPTDRYLLVVSVNIATSTNHSVKVELDIEGTTDSRLVAPLPPPPTITSLTPTSGPVNWSVAIAGTNFGNSQGSSTVKFNTTTATQISNWSNTSITASVPAGTPTGSGPVVVTVNGFPSNTDKLFDVIPPPTLTTVSPGAAHRTDAVTITGNNFLASQFSSTVTVNGTAATTIDSWGNTSIVARVPVGATATPGTVTVTVSNQTSNALPFTVIPPPAVSMTTPSSGLVGASVTIAGTNFGATQGSSSLKFNGTTATPSLWSDTAIVATVPVSATSGDVVVRVSDQPSNGKPFTVLTAGTLAGTITRAAGGTPIAGATVQAVLTGIVKGSATTGANGTYSISNLDPATNWDVRVTASGFSSELRQSISISSSSSTTLDVAMYAPGSVSGKVTQVDGITPLVGAAVTVYAGPNQKGSSSTNGTGDYTIGGLHPGGYTVQAANVGYRTSEDGATVAESATTTKNFSLQGATSGPVRYAYDALGRLVQVTNPESESAIYRYDAVGNITAIERPGASSVAISGFTPVSGLVGATVIISGAGFSATPAQNTVTFNGVAAAVTSVTTTQIVAAVPSGAATGAIGVTTPIGSATSSTPFTVLTSTGAPTITGFTPGTVASGTALTVNGTNFDSVPGNNNLALNGSPAQIGSATGTSIQSTVPPSATTGRVSVSTVNGTATSSDYLWIAPSPYAVTDVESTGMLAFGTGTAVTVNGANKIALRAFEGTQGHRASMNVSGVTGGNVTVSIYSSLGAVLSAVTSAGVFIDPVELHTTATYSVVADPSTTTATTATLTLYDVPADFTSPIAFSHGPVANDLHPLDVVTSAPGQNGRVTFSGATGRRVALDQTGYNCFTSFTTIYKPDGTSLIGTCGGSYIDTQPADVQGTYTILVDPKDASYGTTTLTLYDVPADVTGSTTINGATVPIATTSVGQNGQVTFSGTQGQQVIVHCTHTTNGGYVFVKLLGTDGQTVLASQLSYGGTFTLPAVTLPTAGTNTYTILVDPNGKATTTATIWVTSQ
jgi:YD repeat-containing protein